MLFPFTIELLSSPESRAPVPCNLKTAPFSFQARYERLGVFDVRRGVAVPVRGHNEDLQAVGHAPR